MLLSFLLLFTSAAYAQDDDFRAQLRRSDSGKELLKLRPTLLTQDVRDGETISIIGRDDVALQGFDILARYSGRSFSFVGEAGVGKSTGVERMAQMIVNSELPEAERFQDLLNAEIVKLEGDAILSLNPHRPQLAVAEILTHIENIEQQSGKKVILFVDELHQNIKLLEAFKNELGGRQGQMFIGATTSSEYELFISTNEALARRFPPLLMKEQSVAETLQILEESWRETLQTYYSVEISDEALSVVIAKSPFIYPNQARPAGPISFLQDVVVKAHGSGQTEITANHIYDHVQRVIGVPADPRNLLEVDSYIEETRARLDGQVIGQDQAKDELLASMRELVLSENGSNQVVALTGESGVAKTVLSKALAMDESRFLRIDGANYADATKATTDLFGPKPGMTGFKDIPGRLVTWMEGSGRSFGVLLIDDVHVMHPEKLMELYDLFDNGQATKGNGQTVKTKSLLIVLTSNRGLETLYPQGFNTWPLEKRLEHIRNFSQSDISNIFSQKQSATDNWQMPVPLLNRIDRFVVMDTLTQDMARQVLDLHVERLQQEYERVRGMKIEISEEALDYVTSRVFAEAQGGGRNFERAAGRFFADITSVVRSGNLSVDVVENGRLKNWYFNITDSEGQSHELKNHNFSGGMSDLADFSDPTFFSSVLNGMKEQVYGQDVALEVIVNSVRSWALLRSGKPLFVLAVGSTGVGKSETQRALALQVFGSIDKLAEVSFDQVRNERDLSKIFGGAPELVGHHTTGQFEQALLQLGGGGKRPRGVLALEELTDVATPEERDQILNRLKRITEDGTWTSPQTGTTYNLSDVIFFATGNALQERFYGAATDEERRAIYDRLSPSNQLDFELRQDNVPEALLARADVTVLYAPHDDSSRIRTAQKFLDEVLLELENTVFKGVEINFSEEFSTILAEAFYVYSRGGRSLRNTVRNKVVTHITDALQQAGIHEGNAEDYTLNVLFDGEHIADNFVLQDDSEKLTLKIEVFNSSSDEPVYESSNILESEESKVHLQNLSERIGERVIGQELQVQAVSDAFQSWIVVPTGRPLVIYIDGSTGAGKTETGLVLAEEAYQDPNKAQVVPMAEVIGEKGLNKFFGAEPGYIGNDRIGLLERALEPLIESDGRPRGVVLLDELGDLLNHPDSALILNSLKNLFEEGTWVSPNTGREFNLSEVTFLLTGNALESFYQGITSDQQRLSRYEYVRPRAREIVLSRGFPEALMGRVDLMLHSAPLLEKYRATIAEKFLTQSLMQLEQRFPGIWVENSEELMASVSDIFFNHIGGARSVRQRFQAEVFAIVTQALLDSSTNRSNSSNRVIEIKLDDKRSQRLYSIPGLEEEVRLSVLVKDKETGDVLAERTRDLLENSLKPVERSASEFVKTASHEIGHALGYIIHEDILGMRLQHLTIVPGKTPRGGYLGYAEAEQVRTVSWDVEALRAQLFVTAAGRAAQEVLGYSADTGWSGDYKKMVQLIGKTYVTGGLSDALWGASLNKDGSLVGTDAQKETYQQLVATEVRQALDKAKAYYTENMGELRFLSAQLFRGQGNVSGDELKALSSFYRGESLTDLQLELIERFRNPNQTIDEEQILTGDETRNLHETRASQIRSESVGVKSCLSILRP